MRRMVAATRPEAQPRAFARIHNGTRDAEGRTGPNGGMARLGTALNDRFDSRPGVGEVSVAAERGNACRSGGGAQVEAWHRVVRVNP